MKLNFLLISTACIITLAFTPAHAEFIFGGDITIERDIEEFGEPSERYNTSIRGEVVAGYDTGEFAFGVGTRFSESHDDFDLDEDNAFAFVRFGPVTVSHGFGYGAGGMMPEDYFGLDDTTDRNVPMTRIDWAFENAHFAFSVDDDGDTEWGASTKLGDYFVRAAYETSGEDFQIAVARDLGGWGYHAVLHNDLDDNGDQDQLAGTLLYDVSESMRVAGSIAVNGEGELDSYGLVAWYEFGADISPSFGPATLRFQYLNEVDEDNKSVELGISLPFGNPAPNLYQRSAQKENYSGYGFY